MRSWRNWQTRTFEGRVGNHVGSSPTDRTKFAYFSRLWEFCFQSLFSYAEIKTCAFIRFKILFENHVYNEDWQSLRQGKPYSIFVGTGLPWLGIPPEEKGQFEIFEDYKKDETDILNYFIQHDHVPGLWALTADPLLIDIPDFKEKDAINSI